MRPESLKRAQAKYDDEKTTQKKIKFVNSTDADILEYLDKDPEAFATKVKRLIREEMGKTSQTSTAPHCGD